MMQSEGGAKIQYNINVAQRQLESPRLLHW